MLVHVYGASDDLVEFRYRYTAGETGPGWSSWEVTFDEIATDGGAWTIRDRTGAGIGLTVVYAAGEGNCGSWTIGVFNAAADPDEDRIPDWATVTIGDGRPDGGPSYSPLATIEVYADAGPFVLTGPDRDGGTSSVWLPYTPDADDGPTGDAETDAVLADPDALASLVAAQSETIDALRRRIDDLERGTIR